MTIWIFSILGGMTVLAAILAWWRMAPLLKRTVRPPRGTADGGNTPSPLDETAQNIAGETVSLSPYKGRVVLIVNVASRCGFTPQYDGLEALYQKYRERGLVVLGFPCNDFGGQEPGENAEIESFCRVNHGVTFPMMGKIAIKGQGKHAVFRALAAGEFAGEIQWNFAKFLVDRSGHVCARFGPMVRPLGGAMTAAIERALGTK